MSSVDIGVSVVLACYTHERLSGIRSAVASLRHQSLRPRQIIVSVDNNPALADLLTAELTDVTVVLNNAERGASATRNRGAEAVTAPYTAFLDDDEAAHPDWLRMLTAPFADAGVVGTGGRYEASWLTAKPGWFPDEFAWVVGGSYEGLPTETAPVRNVWSGNMAVRTDAFRRVAGFRTDFGKRGAVPQPEDTDLCIRMAADSQGIWMYVPDAVIYHSVPADRASVAFFVRRCYAEGAGKAAMQRHLAARSAVDTEHRYVREVFVKALRRLTRRNRAAVRQGVAMLVGLASAAVGYLRGSAVRTPGTAA